MIEERYCSYEVSNLLQEKGFNQECYGRYSTRSKEFHFDATRKCENHGLFIIAAPTHQMAMKWLREVYNLQIIIIPIRSRSTQHKNWTFEIYKNFSSLDVDVFTFPTYEEDCEAALKYVLEKLI